MADATHAITPTTTHGELPGGGAWDVYKIFDNELINAAATVDSIMGIGVPGMELAQFSTFGIYVVLAGTTPDVTFSLLQSYNNTAANFVAPESNAQIINVADADGHTTFVAPVPMPFFRIRAIGAAGNGADVRANCWIFMRT